MATKRGGISKFLTVQLGSQGVFVAKDILNSQMKSLNTHNQEVKRNSSITVCTQEQYTLLCLWLIRLLQKLARGYFQKQKNGCSLQI